MSRAETIGKPTGQTALTRAVLGKDQHPSPGRAGTKAANTRKGETNQEQSDTVSKSGSQT